MGRRILLINGHPDPRPERLCAALADAYQAGARKALTRGVFWLSGMRPIRSTLIGGVGQGAQTRWINVARGLGWRGG